MAIQKYPGLPTLDDYRSWLRFPVAYTRDDFLIQNWLAPSALKVFTHECGDFVATTYDEFYDGGDYSIWLRNTPVLSVQLVEEGWGFTDYSLTEVQVNSSSMPTMFAFSIDMQESGKISRRSGGNVNIPFIRGESNIHVIYSAGRTEVPEDIGMGMLQLVQFWYRAFLADQSSNDPYATVTEEYDSSRSGAAGPTAGTYFGLPTWLVEVVKPYKRDPVIG